MQKMIQVVAGRNERNKVQLAEKIETSVSEFVSSVNGKLEDYVVSAATLSEEGYGHALVTVNYELIPQNGGKKNENK